MLTRELRHNADGKAVHRWVRQDASNSSGADIPSPQLKTGDVVVDATTLRSANMTVDRLHNTSPLDGTMTTRWDGRAQAFAPDELAAALAKVFPASALHHAAELLEGKKRTNTSVSLLVGMLEPAELLLDPEWYVEERQTKEDGESNPCTVDDIPAMVADSILKIKEARAIRAIEEFDPDSRKSISALKDKAGEQSATVINAEMDRGRVSEAEMVTEAGELVVPLMLLNSIAFYDNFDWEQPGVRTKLLRIRDEFDRIVPFLGEFKARGGIYPDMLDEFEANSTPSLLEGVL